MCRGTGTVQARVHAQAISALTYLPPSEVLAAGPDASAAVISAAKGSAGSNLAARSDNVSCCRTCSCLMASFTATKLIPSIACTTYTAAFHVEAKGQSGGRSDGSCKHNIHMNTRLSSARGPGAVDAK